MSIAIFADDELLPLGFDDAKRLFKLKFIKLLIIFELTLLLAS